MEQIPLEWQVEPDHARALRELIVRRAEYVADTIELKLWPPQFLPLKYD